MIWRTEFRHGVIGDPRQCRDILSRADVLDRRIGQRDHLSVVADLVHLAKARIQIDSLVTARSRCPIFSMRGEIRVISSKSRLGKICV
jgi:hypothetical protein